MNSCVPLDADTIRSRYLVFLGKTKRNTLNNEMLMSGEVSEVDVWVSAKGSEFVVLRSLIMRNSRRCVRILSIRTRSSDSMHWVSGIESSNQ